jgi:hypothetical protein
VKAQMGNADLQRKLRVSARCVATAVWQIKLCCSG